MKNYTEQEIQKISSDCIEAVRIILAKHKLSVGHVDNIIDNLMATFAGNSMVNVGVNKQNEYLKNRLESLSCKLAHVCEVVHKLTCDNCKHEIMPEEATIH